jgi:hypothetical protein
MADFISEISFLPGDIPPAADARWPNIWDSNSYKELTERFSENPKYRATT